MSPAYTTLSSLAQTNEADMTVYTSALPTAVAPGGTVNLDSTIINYGPDQATSATLSMTLPPDVDVNTAQTPIGSCTVTPITGGTSVSCPLGDMDAFGSETASINLTVDVAAGTNLQLSTTVGSTTPEPFAGDNTANVVVLVRTSQSAPSGTLAFVSHRDGNAEIYLTNAGGSGVANLTNNAAYDWEPAWSPDGAHLVFNSDRINGEEVWVMDADGSNPTQLTTNGSNGANFAWSPDGTKIAWQNWDSSTNTYDICIVNADGTGFSNLTNDAEHQDRPQWSPDGTKILYQSGVYNTLTQTSLPDVFVMNADGSGKTNLTSTPDASDFAPVWSPDGTQIAFGRGYDDQGIYVMDADGSDPVNLTQTIYDGYPSWSPDGTQIAFARFVNNTDMIYLMNSDGTSQTPAFTGNYEAGAKGEWSPDGAGLAFDTDQDGNTGVYAVNADGSGLTNVTNTSEYDFAAKWQPLVPQQETNNPNLPPEPTPTPTPTPAPDNDHFANAQVINNDTGSVSVDNSYATSEVGEPDHASHAVGLSVWYQWQAATSGSVTFDTSGSSVDTVLGVYTGSSVNGLTVVASNDDTSSDGYSLVSFTATANTIYYIALDTYDGAGSPGPMTLNWQPGAPAPTPTPATSGRIAFGSAHGNTMQVFIMNGDGGAHTRLTDKTYDSHEPLWSPDGTKIAFRTFRDGQSEIYSMNPDGSNQIRLTNSSGSLYPSWSPDSTKLVFSSFDSQYNSNVFVVNADGTGLTNLSNDSTGTSFMPSWSPDGTKIMFLSSRDATQSIYLMDPDGSNTTRLTNSPDDAPVWSPDGTKIAFVRWGLSGAEIYSMNADGSNQTNLTNTAALLPEAPYNFHPVWSPDGTQIAFTSYREWIAQVYVVGADGSNLTQLTSTGESAQPRWSPDGTQIAFITYRGGDQELYVMNPDGSNQTNLTNNLAYDAAFSWQPLPPSNQ
jgi:Tol biopolymer transport system component